MKTRTKVALAAPVVAGLVGGLGIGTILNATPAHAEIVNVCGWGYGVGAGTPTSCAFAGVARATWIQDTRQSPIVVYSPVTNMTYTMWCHQDTLDGHFAIECNGGNDADVWFW